MELVKTVSDYLHRAFKTDISYIEFFTKIREFKEWYEGETKWHEYTTDDKPCGDSFLNHRVPGGKKSMNLIKCPR